jgi:hypothetical protein
MPHSEQNVNTCNIDPVHIAAEAPGTPTQKLIAVLQACGVTDTAKLSKIIGINPRGVRRARASKTEGRAYRTANAGLQDRGEGLQARADSSSESPLPPKKGLPQTPSKESPPYPPQNNQRECSNAARERTHEVPHMPGTETHLVPASSKIVFRGQRLVVTQEQHRLWQGMFPGFDLSRSYPIADADCLRTGKTNGSVIPHAQMKLGYLARDWARETDKVDPEARFKRRPGYMGRG